MKKEKWGEKRWGVSKGGKDGGREREETTYCRKKGRYSSFHYSISTSVTHDKKNRTEKQSVCQLTWIRDNPHVHHFCSITSTNGAPNGTQWVLVVPIGDTQWYPVVPAPVPSDPVGVWMTRPRLGRVRVV